MHYYYSSFLLVNMYTPPPTLSPNTTISSILTNSAIDMDMDMENEAPSSSSSSSPRHSTHACHKKKAGRRKFKETRHPVYRGVRRRNGDRWVCEVREPNKKSRIWLGTYPTPEMAARAHDAAALALRGTSAIFNFPDSAFLLPLAASSSATDIRTAAAKAAAQVSSNSSHNNNASKSKFQEITGKLMEDCSINRDERNISNSSDHEYSSNNHNYNNTLFLDEEALYNMPALLDSMAEGMLLTPPSMTRALDWDNVPSSHDDVDFTLWTH